MQATSVSLTSVTTTPAGKGERATGVQSSAPVSAFEWRRLDQHPTKTLARKFPAFHAMGGSLVSLDISYVVDISEIANSSARAAATADYESRLRAYIASANSAGLRVEGLAGSPHWIGPETRYVTGIVQSFVTGFNRNAVKARRLGGLHFDLEPWSTPQWSANAVDLTTQLLDTVAEISRRQLTTPPAHRVPIKVDLPFWLDGSANPKSVKHKSEKNNSASVPPTERIMQLLDNRSGQANAVVLMAYRDKTDGIDDSIAISANEFLLASKFGGRVKVVIAQEIGAPVGDPPRTTFYEEGLPALRQAMKELTYAYQNQRSFGGFAIDHLAALDLLL